MRLRVILALAATAGVVAAGERFVLENNAVGRALSTEGGTLRTVGLMNKRAGLAVEPQPSAEFRLRLSQGTHRPDTAFTLTAADFRVTASVRDRDALTFRLENRERGLSVEVRYELKPGDFFLR